MELDRPTMEILRPAADSLRRALRRMDDEDVPASLRAVADSSARRLPPPLLKRALLEIDGSEWLRDEILAEDDLAAGSASDLFVARPEGWESAILERASEAVKDRTKARVSELEKELADALARGDDLQRQLEAAGRKAAEAETRGRERARLELESAQRARRHAERQAKDEAHQAARMSAHAERLEAELDSSRARLENVRVLLEKERRSAAVTPSTGQPRSWFPDDPVEMAEELDRIRTAIRRGPPVSPAPSETAENGGHRVQRLPAALRPDRVEVIRWLMAQPLQWLIDGYNVAFHLADDPDSATRDRLVACAGNLASQANSGTMVVVVFDSSVDTSTLPADRRVRVVFAPSADEWILEHARPGSVVVSSDRRVREGSESSGALGVWSEALAEWISPGTTAGSPTYSDG